MPSFAPATGRERVTLIGVVVVFTLTSFQELAVSAVLPNAAQHLGGIGSFGWVYTGFITAKIIGLVVAGQYSDSHGPRGVLVAGIAVFTAGLVLCGCAPTMTVLIAGRLLQGLASGLLLTSLYVVIGQVFSDEAGPRVQSAIGASFILPSLIGPVVAGEVAEQLNWRWTFFGILPFVAVGIALMLPVLRGLHRPEVRIVRRNALPFAVALAAAIAAIEQVGQQPPPWPILAPILLVAAALLAKALPAVLPAGTLRLQRGVAAPIGLRGIYAGALIGAEAFIPLTLTVQHGYGPTAAALPLAAGGVTWALGSWVQGRPAHGDELDYRIWLVRVGFCLTGLGILVAAAVSYSAVPGWWAFGGWCLAGAGGGMAMTTCNVLMLRNTNDQDRGFDSAATQLAGAASAALVTAFGGVLVAVADRGAIGFDTAFVTLNLTTVTLLALGLAGTPRLRAAAIRPVPVTP